MKALVLKILGSGLDSFSTLFMLQMSEYSLDKLSALSLENKAVIFDLIMRTDLSQREVLPCYPLQTQTKLSSERCGQLRIKVEILSIVVTHANGA